MKKGLFFLLSVILFLTTAQAEENTPQTTPPDENAVVEAAPAQAVEEGEPEKPEYAVEISGNYAALIDADSGKILFEKNGNAPTDPASLTKIMTVYLACENLPLSSQLTMSDAAFGTYDHNQGVLWIQQGETLSVEDCAYASMLASANDTTAMLAEATSGSVEGFVEKMNQEAVRLGMENTSFDNCFGYSSEGNHASAADIALLCRHALKNESFQKIFGAVNYSIPATNKSAQSRVIAQDCALLKEGDYFYDAASGGKIGSTAASGYSLCVSAKRDATSLIAVVLGEENADTAYHDIVHVLEYGFSSAQTVTFTPEEIGTREIEVMDGGRHVADVTFSCQSSFNILLPADIDPDGLTAEVEVQNEDSADPEKISAQVVFRLNGEEIGTAPMERRIVAEPEPEPVDPGVRARQIFDYISIAALAVIVLFPIIIRFFTSLEPPK